MRNTPQPIADDWQPSNALSRWAQQMHIAPELMKKCLLDFVLWHTEKQVKRANFNLAFRNWLKKELDIDAKKIKPASFTEFQPETNVQVASKATGQHFLDKIKGKRL